MDFGLLNWSDQWMMWTGEKGSRDLLSAEDFLISMQHNGRAKNLEIFIKIILVMKCSYLIHIVAFTHFHVTSLATTILESYYFFRTPVLSQLLLVLFTPIHASNTPQRSIDQRSLCNSRDSIYHYST